MPLLGCIADDFTGATDLASTLVKGGMTAVQVIGVLGGPLPEADAVVVALKSRTAPVADAVRDSLAALDALRAALEAGGVVFIPEDGGGAGVRLKDRAKGGER